MRILKASVATLALLAVCAGVVLAAEAAPRKSSAPATQEVAVFSVPMLMEGTVLKDLVKAVADKPGILSAQADSAKSTLSVTFETKKTKPDRILKALNSVSKDAKLVAVAPADARAAGKHDCGKCPLAKGCPGTKK
jgi:copper chaperone CopZ